MPFGPLLGTCILHQRVCLIRRAGTCQPQAALREKLYKLLGQPLLSHAALFDGSRGSGTFLCLSVWLTFTCQLPIKHFLTLVISGSLAL